MNKKFDGVVQKEYTAYFKFFDHGDGPATVDDQDFRYNVTQRERLSLMKRWVQRTFVRKICVLVCQFDNLQKNVTTNGIIHYNAITVRARQLCLPILHKYKALYITTNLENICVLFDTPGQAACAAYDIKHVLNAYKYSLDASRSKFQTRLKAIGIDMGDNILIDALGQVHGVAMSNARAYAEAKFPSTSQEGSIFLSLNIVNNISSIPTFHMANFAPRNDLNCFELSGDIDYKSAIVPCTDMRFLDHNLQPLALRNQKGMDIEKIDKTVRLTFVKTATVLQINVEAPAAFVEKFGLEYAIIHRVETPQIIANCVQKYDAQSIADDIYIFKNAASAVNCAKLMLSTLEKWNSQCKDERNIRKISGFGIDTSVCVYIPRSDVYWGRAFDVVNTICCSHRSGEVLVTANVYSDIVDSGMFRTLRAIPSRLNVSPNTSLSLFTLKFENHFENIKQTQVSSARTSKHVHFGDTTGENVLEQEKTALISARSSTNPRGPISSLGAIIKSEGDYVGTDWGKIVRDRELERYNTMSTIDTQPDPGQFLPTSTWVQKTMAERKRDEYNRTKEGFGSLGNPNDVLLQETSMIGRKFADVPRGNEKVLRTPVNRLLTSVIRPTDTNEILNLGAQASPLKTRNLFKSIRTTIPSDKSIQIIFRTRQML